MGSEHQRSNDRGGMAVMERERAKVQPPRKFGVALDNDDYTPMDFVVHVLVSVFSLPNEVAERITMEIHRRGQGVVGPYTRDIAETRASQAMALARAAGHPLLCRVTPWPE